MKILIAEDDPVSRLVLETAVAKWGYEPIVTVDGEEAWKELGSPSAPSLAVLDWMMPGLSGLEVCQRVRQQKTTAPTYIILLTAKGRKQDILEGFAAGVDDYVIKPFDHEELKARVRVGARVVTLQAQLAERVVQLEEAVSRVKELDGLLPICSYCKKIRDGKDYWHQVEAYVTERSHARFTHGICPECYPKVLNAATGDDPD